MLVTGRERLLSSLIAVPFVHRVTVRFHEVDRAGIAFFGRVFEYCHAAFEELMLSIDGGIETLIERERFGMPLVHADADFVRPLRLHDRIDVELVVDKLSERSVRFAYTLRVDGEVRAKAKLVHA